MVSADSPDGTPSIALIHGVPTSITPAMTSLRNVLPQARLWNLLDDKLIDDATAAGSVTPELQQRMQRLIDHALTAGVDAIVITCSLYAFMAARQTTSTPVLGSDEAAFREAIDVPGRVLLVSSVPLALRDSEERLLSLTQASNRRVTVVPLFVEGALAAAGKADSETLSQLIAERAEPHLQQGDALLLAQYSLAPAADAVAERLGVTVISPPAATARELRRELSNLY